MYNPDAKRLIDSAAIGMEAAMRGHGGVSRLRVYVHPTTAAMDGRIVWTHDAAPLPIDGRAAIPVPAGRYPCWEMVPYSGLVSVLMDATLGMAILPLDRSKTYVERDGKLFVVAAN